MGWRAVRRSVCSGTASPGVCRSGRRGARPGPPSIAALAESPLGARRTTPRLMPMQDFHYIRHDRCYLHPVMFFDSLLRLLGRLHNENLFTFTYYLDRGSSVGLL